jgi:MFS family permease
MRRTPVVFGAVSLDLFAVLLGGATALLPIYARDILMTGPSGLGLLRTAPAVGALAASLAISRRPIRKHAGRILFGAVTAFGLATIVFGLSHNYALSFVALGFLGASDVVSVVIRSSLVALRTPDDMRGRVNAVNSLFVGTSNQLGEFESGLTAAWLGPIPAVVVGGIGSVLVAIVWARLFPELAATGDLHERLDVAERESERETAALL